jgi:NDP-sugar pyrophosphorylase family protein
MWQLEWLARGGVTDVHLAAGHLADVLQKWIAENSCGLRLTISTEPAPLGTGGGLKFVEPHLVADPFLVLNGDSLMPRLAFQALEKQHAAFSNPWKSAGAATLAVTRIAEAGRYGTVEFDAARRITAFREKASRSEGFINGGVYLMDRALLAAIAPGKNISIETDIFPALAAAGRLQAVEFPQPLLDMGTPEGIRAMENFLAAEPR